MSDFKAGIANALKGGHKKVHELLESNLKNNRKTDLMDFIAMIREGELKVNSTAYQKGKEGLAYNVNVHLTPLGRRRLVGE